MEKLKIQTGAQNPILRKKSEELSNKEIKELANENFFETLIAKMYEDDGIGLAAPQIGKNIRLFVIGKDANPKGHDLVVINPKITYFSLKKCVAEEGCLSLPQITADVSRPAKIRIKFLDHEGNNVEIKAKGLLARVLQHEFDHLEGILFIDRVKK